MLSANVLRAIIRRAKPEYSLLSVFHMYKKSLAAAKIRLQGTSLLLLPYIFQAMLNLSRKTKQEHQLCRLCLEAELIKSREL